MKSIVIAMLLLQGAAAPVAAPLTPSGKWVVEYGDSDCVLSRDFGTGSARTTVGFKPSPFGDSVEIVTMTAGAKSGYRNAKAKLTLQPSGFTAENDASIYGLKDKGVTLTTFIAQGAAVANLQTSTGVALTEDAGPGTNIAVPDMKKAFGALKVCQVDLVKRWGVDPGELDRVAVLATPLSPERWITHADYPAEALKDRQQGTSRIMWAIGTTGRVSDCKVVQSSGSAALDGASCLLIARRGRYKPALGIDDEPVPTHAMRKVIWRLP